MKFVESISSRMKGRQKDIIRLILNGKCDGDKHSDHALLWYMPRTLPCTFLLPVIYFKTHLLHLASIFFIHTLLNRQCAGEVEFDVIRIRFVGNAHSHYFDGGKYYPSVPRTHASL